MPAADIVENLRAISGREGNRRVPGALELAEAFGWSHQHTRTKEISWESHKLELSRAFLGVQPAALFASAPQSDGRPEVNGAALYGYHAAVRWGLIATQRGLTPFNSHWLNNDQWFTLPTVEWGDLESRSEILEAFRPDGISEGRVDQIALQQFPLPTLLQPVDDELVERLDAWRDEALKGSRAASGVDEQLQVLFAKLFVLRTIEDRNLANSVPPLRGSLVNGGVNLEMLWDIFTSAKQYIGSELFDEVNLELIPPHVIAGIIDDLYVPRRLPGLDLTYNFSWIDADVLGLAYEKYLSTILHPRPPAPQPDLFKEQYRGVERISVRKAGGVYYTPQYLTRYLANKTIDQFYDANPDAAIPSVVDFACGSGSFLVAAVDALLNRLKAREPDTNWGKALIDGGYINGVDVDNKAVTVARLNIWNRLAEEPDPLPLPNLSRVIVQGDGLDRSSWGDLDRRYDIALGNPPFLATSHVEDRAGLEARFLTARGRYDYSYLFVEQAIDVTSPSGLIGMVIPNRMFRNANSSAIRALIASTMDISTIVDFGAIEVFKGTAAYVGCIVAEHRAVLSQPKETVKVIEAKALPEQFISALLLNAEAGAHGEEIRVYEAQHPRSGAPWVLLSADEKLAQVKISDASVTLSEIAGIFQGIRTGANDLFLFDVVAEDRGVGVELINGLGDAAVIESSLLRPVVFGSEVRRYQRVVGSKVILYPYVDGVTLSEAELASRYPLTYKYLVSYRDILSARNSIKASGQRWYELVRRRDELWLNRPKLLIRDLAPETAFAVDDQGGVFMVGGTAVMPDDEELIWPLLAYLNSQSISALVRRTTPQFRGAFQKFEPQHLQKIPIMTSVLEPGGFGDRLGTLARQITDSLQASEFDAARSAMKAVDVEVSKIMAASDISFAT